MQSQWQERVALHRSRVDPSLAEGSRGRKPLSPDGERLYEQSLRSGEPRPITAEGVETTLSFPFSPSVKEVLVFSDKAWRIQPVGGGEPRSTPGRQDGDDAIRLGQDGRSFTSRRACDELSSGRRRSLGP